MYSYNIINVIIKGYILKLIKLFTQNLPARQKQYEAIRAVAFQEGNIKEIAARFRYSPQTLRNLVNKVLKGKHDIFPEVKPGPKGRQTPDKYVDTIIDLRRKKKLSSYQISEEFKARGISIGVRTVERILSDAGFPKLRRRTFEELGLSKKGTLIPQRSAKLDFDLLKPFRAECKVAGVFLFLPYIIESRILDVVEKCGLPESSDINSRQAALSMLCLKLIGGERLSYIRNYDTDVGFGVFAGLNVLPKPTYMGTYSCRTNADMLLKFQKKIISRFQELYPRLYEGKTINLDFHSIPHFGNESSMERVWCGARGKSMKGANTFFAQDGDSNAIMYARSDIKRSEASEEIKKFIDYWIGLKGVMDQMLVFDSKLTRYEILYEIDEAAMKFITLRRRSKNMIDKALAIPDEQWLKVKLPIPKRKYKNVKVHESKVALLRNRKKFRQIIIKDHGRSEPTFIISNNEELEPKELLTIYARRWHIENKLSDLVDFFSINKLSSPVMIRIHFDLLWTVIADSLYHLFAADLRRFENLRGQSLFRKFVDMPGIIDYDGEKFNVKIRKRNATPVLMGVEKLKGNIAVPWLDNRPVRIIWTP